MRFKLGLTLFVALTFFSQLSMALSGSCGKAASWSFDESSGTLTISGEGAMENYQQRLPANYYAPAWKDFADDIKHIVVGAGITEIGDQAFLGLKQVETVSLPEGITYIGNYAFNLCISLKEIKLPESLEYIGMDIRPNAANGYSFADCSKLENITIPRNLKRLSGYSFYNCKNLKVVNWNAIDCAGDAHYTGLYDSMFAESTVNTVNFGPEVKTVPDQLFKSVGLLAYINTKGSIEYVGRDAFKNTLWETAQDHEKVIYIDRAAYLYLFDFSDYRPINIKFRSDTRGITDYIFDGCDRLSTVDIPEEVTRIGANSFKDCQSLTEIVWSAKEAEFVNTSTTTNYRLPNSLRKITFGDKVKTIPPYMLAECTALNEISLPQSLVTINERAFYGCGVSSLTIPDGVTSLGQYAIYNCANLETLTIGEGLTDLEWLYFLSGCPVKTLYWNAVRVKDNPAVALTTSTCFAPVENFIVGDKVEYIPSYIFYGNTSLTNVKFGKAVEEIGSRSFQKCIGLKNIKFPSSLKTINSNAFADCGLESVVIPENVTSLKENAFDSNSIKYAVFTSLSAPTNEAFNRNDADLIFYVPDITEYQKYSAMGGYPFKGRIVESVTPDKTIFDINNLDEKVTFICNIPEYDLEIINGPQTESTVGKHRCIVEGKFIGKQDFTSKFVYDYEVSGTSGITALDSDTSKVDIYNAAGCKIYEGVDENSVDNLLPGFYIIKNDRQTKKVVIR